MASPPKTSRQLLHDPRSPTIIQTRHTTCKAGSVKYKLDIIGCLTSVDFMLMIRMSVEEEESLSLPHTAQLMHMMLMGLSV